MYMLGIPDHAYYEVEETSAIDYSNSVSSML